MFSGFYFSFVLKIFSSCFILFILIFRAIVYFVLYFSDSEFTVRFLHNEGARLEARDGARDILEHAVRHNAVQCLAYIESDEFQEV
jgi:hypothetical protein